MSALDRRTRRARRRTAERWARRWEREVLRWRPFIERMNELLERFPSSRAAPAAEQVLNDGVIALDALRALPKGTIATDEDRENWGALRRGLRRSAGHDWLAERAKEKALGIHLMIPKGQIR